MTDDDTTENDIDSVLKYHQEIQEKVASEMVELAKNMKETAKAASRVVQDDNKVSLVKGETYLRKNKRLENKTWLF